MDTILQTLLSWQFLIFGTAVAAVMFVLRKTIEYAMANWTPLAKESKLWNELLLPILPVIIGCSGALLFKTYPYPDGLTTNGGRFIFGLVAGLLSTLIYRVTKAMINQKISGVTSVATGTPDAPVDPVQDVKAVVNQVQQTTNKQ
jgi:hypothetical protein